MKQLLIWEHDGTVERVWQTTVAPADHHGTNYELTERAEHAAERGHHGWVAEAQPHVSAVTHT